MRAFLGLSPDSNTKLAIEAWREKALPGFNHPVPAANFHVTLCFLGELNDKQYEVMAQGIEQISDIKAFSVHLNTLGYWPKPKAFWLGCDAPEPSHLNLVKRLTSIARQSKISIPKQAYKAHLTLARKCVENPPAALIAPDFLWQAKAFHLFESVSTRQGVRYQIRESWPLARVFSWQK